MVTTEDSAVGFYALNGESLVNFTKDETKERICEVLEQIREQNSGTRMLLVLDKYGDHICEYTRNHASARRRLVLGQIEAKLIGGR